MVFVFHVTKDNSKYGRTHSETMALSKEGEKQRMKKMIEAFYGKQL